MTIKVVNTNLISIIINDFFTNFIWNIYWRSMCYDIAYLTRKIEYYEARFGASYGDVPFAAMYHSNGFDHMDIPVITTRN